MVERWLTPNQWSRGQEPMQRVLGVTLHWFGKPGQSAEGVWEYFERRKLGQDDVGSAHFIADPTVVLQCMPLSEIAYHAGPKADTTAWARERYGDYPNAHLVGVEMAHVDWDGRIVPATLANVRMLCAWLCWRFDLNPMSDIIRHFDVTGKLCPRFFVEHPEDLDLFRDSVKATMIAAAAA
jgi:N-acetylmuramoyl-L-alanine amidase